jgi:pilus assembly protein Flp/PilA
LTDRSRLAESNRAKEAIQMTAILNASWKLKIWKDTRGQDLMEYALLGGFLAAACAATLPDFATSIFSILSKVVAVLTSTDPTTAPGG